MPRKLSPRSLESEIYQSLRDSISKGEMVPGDPLVEASLATQFGTSKTPVREAIIRLKGDGLVETAPHYVSRVAAPTPEWIREAIEMRIWIEGAIAEDCARKQDPAVIESLRKSVVAAEESLARGHTGRYLSAIRAFSDRLLEASSNHYALEAIDGLRSFLGLIAHAAREVPGRRERSIQEHREILAAIVAGDPAAARDATTRHLRSIEADSLSVLPAGLAPSSDQALVST